MGVDGTPGAVYPVVEYTIRCGVLRSGLSHTAVAAVHLVWARESDDAGGEREVASAVSSMYIIVMALAPAPNLQA